jgi:hypothetical protein
MIVCVSETDAQENMICPRTIGIGPVYHPTDGQGIMEGGPWNCMGSKCMAWRWVRTHIKNPAAPEGDLIASDDTHGYCGMAGPPER